MLNKNDLKQIEDYGLTLQTIYTQLETYSLGIPFVDVVTSASVGNGIEVIPEEITEKLIDIYDKEKSKLEIVKFIPASGAATRMFKFLHTFLAQYDPEKEKFSNYMARNESHELKRFFDSVNEFPFVNELRKKIRKNYPDFKRSNKGQRNYWLVKSMLEEEGLNFSNLPKGLIPFHKYAKYATTPFEEQMYEAAYYASAGDDVYLHFTFSEPHVGYFGKTFKAVKNRIEKKTKSNLHISYSFQKQETDTIAVKPDNHPFRNEDGELVFRPSGHGALLENLNEVDADVIFIKNIDNVVASEYVEGIARYKKLLAGKLLRVQQKAFAYLEQIEKDETSDDLIKEIRSFLWNELSIKDIPFDPHRLFNILNRPIRVCGVVRNTGEPGGGPFWVKNENGEVSLQIVETAQIDMDDPRCFGIVQEATHFNPVDIVCGVRDYKGNKFDLNNFKDPSRGFITIKSEEGKTIKALELPGLWNGAMAYWNTAFVEVPESTFNPVKTVIDLLKKEHRPNA